MKSHIKIAHLAACLAGSGMVLLSGCGGSSQKVSQLVITTGALPNGTAETQYKQPIQASGGVGPYTWSISAGTPPHNLRLDASNSVSTTISGMPDTPVQGDTFTVKVTDSAGQTATQPYTVSIMGVPDTLTLSPAGLTFNPQVTGTASKALTTEMNNAGSSSVVILGVAAGGTNGGDFSQANTCVAGLAPAASCEVTVTFTPSQPGPRVGSININDDTVGTPHQLGLNGIGLSPGPNATLSAPSLSFPGQAVGTRSAAQTLTLTNYGAATLNISNIAVSADFSATSTCGASLASMASCSINIAFAPSVMGNLSGMLSVTGNLGGGPQGVSLSGTGVSTQGTLTGECFGTTAVGSCYTVKDLTSCPVGTAAKTPQYKTIECFPTYNSVQQFVDSSRGCQGTVRTGGKVAGLCVVSN